MRVYDNGIYRDATQEEIDLINSVVSEDLVSIEERVLSLEQTHSPEFKTKVTLYADKWSGDGSPYTQVMDIDGVTQYSKIDLQPNTEQLSIFHEKDMAFVAENEDGIVTISCLGQKPMHDYTMQITITEVVVNE